MALNNQQLLICHKTKPNQLINCAREFEVIVYLLSFSSFPGYAGHFTHLSKPCNEDKWGLQ